MLANIASPTISPKALILAVISTMIAMRCQWRRSVSCIVRGLNYRSMRQARNRADPHELHIAPCVHILASFSFDRSRGSGTRQMLHVIDSETVIYQRGAGSARAKEMLLVPRILPVIPLRLVLANVSRRDFLRDAIAERVWT